ncbi:MAG: hypothetical protein HFG43_05860 [Lachnospiraceae bacterium]|nr:hypothetical protein [Lachnospiraceae bacterium]
MENESLEKERLKQKIRNKLLNKRIVLVGTGKESANFYNNYGDRLKIEIITANYFLGKALEEYNFIGGVETKKISELDPKKNSDYFYIIAIAYDVSYLTVSFQLEEMGLSYGEDFIDYNIAEAILSDKKILITAGDCLLDAIAIGLDYYTAFKEKYYVKHFWNLGRSKFFNKLYYRMAKICDFYVMNRHLIDPYNFYFEKDELPKDSQIILIATPEFRGYWPQTPKKESVVNKYHIFPHDGHPVGFVMREDMNINSVIDNDEKIDIKSLICRLQDENFYSREYVIRNYDVSINILKHAERDCDVKISDYFIDNMSAKKTAKEYSHYQNALILEICRRLVEYLEPNQHREKDLELKVKGDILPFTEMPIYPCVAKYLGLNEITENTKYKIRTYKGSDFFVDPYTYNKVYYGIEELTFAEYVERYYEYCMTAKKLMKVW